LLKFEDDSLIREEIGDNSFQLLRWILFSNQSHFITLPEHLKLKEFPQSIQLLAITSSPKAEIKFQEGKQKFGSCFFWHGSWGERWYPIQRTGLKNFI
jgi:hypothetical protein